MNIVGISGSPSPRSRSGWLLQWAQTQLEGVARQTDTVGVPDPALAERLSRGLAPLLQSRTTTTPSEASCAA